MKKAEYLIVDLLQETFILLMPIILSTLKKLKLFRHIKTLDIDHVIIDLGAGSHILTVDTFLIANKMNLLITPEKASIENMYDFIKRVLFRKLKDTLKIHGLSNLLLEVWKDRAKIWNKKI